MDFPYQSELPKVLQFKYKHDAVDNPIQISAKHHGPNGGKPVTG